MTYRDKKIVKLSVHKNTKERKERSQAKRELVENIKTDVKTITSAFEATGYALIMWGNEGQYGVNYSCEGSNMNPLQLPETMRECLNVEIHSRLKSGLEE